MRQLDPMHSSARQGGGVRRYHTWPVHRQQTVAEHSWNVARIVSTIWPEAPANVLLYCLFHDVGEIATGDIPFPVKAENPELKTVLDRLEGEAVDAMGLPPHPINSLWRGRVKVCDIIEMWEFGTDEELLGNVMAQPITNRTFDKMKELMEALSKDDVDKIWCYIRLHLHWRQTMELRAGGTTR